MHIPDSVISPSTCAACGAAMLPVWAVAARRVRSSLASRQMPLLALGSAFCFTVMLFNIPALGGSTAHPVAGTLLAILLGPWAAVIGVSVALAIQALFFGDGGLLAFGANCFTMAFVLPFVGYSVYRFLAARLSSGAPLRALCAGAGAYVGINAAAAMVGVLLGIQPALFHEANGHALYFPFGLAITLPAMLGTHLLMAGPAEAVVTAAAIRYLQSARIPLYGSELTGGKPGRAEALWVGVLALVALSPLGLLASGSAWGEWSTHEMSVQIARLEGHPYTPRAAAEREARGFHGVAGLAGYAQPEDGANRRGYIASALLGVGVIAGTSLLLGLALAKRTPPTDGGDGGEVPPAGPGGTELPAWLTAPAEPASESERSRSNPFLERTLAELTANAATTLQGEPYARRDGLLQRLDPRARLLSLMALIAAAGAVRHPAALMALYATTLLLAVASRIPISHLSRRVWLAAPIFVGAIALPSLLNVVTPGRELLVLWSAPHVAITTAGLWTATRLTLRVAIAISFGALLTLSTGWSDLLSALRALGLPRLFVTVLAFTYRYIVVLVHSASELFVARRSRTVGRSTNRAGSHFVGSTIGALFGRTLALAEEVNQAMIARGFQGRVTQLAPRRWRPADSLWTVGVAGVTLLVVRLGR